MEQNACYMTYMFDWPVYITVPLGRELKQKYPRYSLVVYGEGEYAESLESLNFQGIPVLFIPGNAGSAEQGRSFSSVALRKTEHHSFHFNYFFVGFNGEMAALKGDYLDKQTEFVHECLKIIINLYKRGSSGNQQDSVLVIAHSMGGIVARGLFTLPNFDPEIVSTLIILAAPNTRPVLMVDSQMKDYYLKVNQFWSSPAQRNQSTSALKHLVVASIGGGNRDFQVRSDLTSMQGLGIDNLTISTLSTTLPKVWVSAEHRCIVWCKQLVLAITRVFMDMVNVNKNRITNDVNERMKILKYHLERTHSHKKSIRETILGHSIAVKHPSSCKQVAKDYLSSVGKGQKICYLMDVAENKGDVVVIYSGSSEDWMHVCLDGTTCKQTRTLSIEFRMIPTKQGQMSVLRMNIVDVWKIGNLIRFSLDGSSKEHLYMKLMNQNTSTYTLSQPMLFAESGLVIPSSRLFTRIVLPFVYYPWLVYNLNISSNCKKQDLVTAMFHIPWSNEDTNFTGSDLHKISLKFYTERPFESRDAEMHLWYPTRCSFGITAWLDVMATAGQLLKFNAEMVIQWVAALCTLQLAFQAMNINSAWNTKYTTLSLLAFFGLRLAFGLATSENTAFKVIVILIFRLVTSVGGLFMLRIVLWIITSFWKAIFKALFYLNQKILKRKLNITNCMPTILLLQLIIPILASQFLCSGLGVLVFILALLLKGATSDDDIQHALELCVIVLVIRSPTLFVWIKEIKYSLKLDNDLFKGSAMATIITMFLFCNARQIYSIERAKMSLFLASSIAMLMTFDCVYFYYVPFLVSAAVCIQCLLVRNINLKHSGFKASPECNDISIVNKELAERPRNRRNDQGTSAEQAAPTTEPCEVAQMDVRDFARWTLIHGNGEHEGHSPGHPEHGKEFRFMVIPSKILASECEYNR
eukprot:gene15092-16648_t